MKGKAMPTMTYRDDKNYFLIEVGWHHKFIVPMDMAKEVDQIFSPGSCFKEQYKNKMGYCLTRSDETPTIKVMTGKQINNSIAKGLMPDEDSIELLKEAAE
jgi:hypothetical protein